MNGIVIIDKPAGWTSHDVVAKLRGAFHEKRIGHGGTLDPMATGVLPVFVGRATRAAEFSENAKKRYIAGFLPGVITDTQDTTGNVLSRSEPQFTQEEFREVLSSFTGPQKQLPPMYSAIKINGQTLYSLARKGIEVEREPREIEIYSISLLGKDADSYILDVECSKGTYIRTLCNDIGEKLGCGGAMSSLRRIAAGSYSIENAVTVEDAVACAKRGEADSLLLPVDSVFSAYPEISVDERVASKIRCGQSVKLSSCEGKVRVYGPGHEFLQFAYSDGEKLKTIKNFF